MKRFFQFKVEQSVINIASDNTEEQNFNREIKDKYQKSNSKHTPFARVGLLSSHANFHKCLFK